MQLKAQITNNLKLSIANSAGITNHLVRIREKKLMSLRNAILNKNRITYRTIQNFKTSNIKPNKLNLLNIKLSHSEISLDGISYYIIYPVFFMTSHSTSTYETLNNPYHFVMDYHRFFSSIIKSETVATAELEERIAKSKEMITQLIINSTELEKFIQYSKVDICLFETKEILPLKISNKPLITYFNAKADDIYNHFEVLYGVEMREHIDIDYLNESISSYLIKPGYQHSLMWFHDHMISNQALAYLGERGEILQPVILGFPTEISDNNDALTLLSFFINYSFRELNNYNLNVEFFCKNQLKLFLGIVTEQTKTIDDVWLNLEHNF